MTDHIIERREVPVAKLSSAPGGVLGILWWRPRPTTTRSRVSTQGSPRWWRGCPSEQENNSAPQSVLMCCSCPGRCWGSCECCDQRTCWSCCGELDSAVVTTGEGTGLVLAAGTVLPETLLTNALLCRRCVIPKKLPDKLEYTFSIDVTGTPHDICDVKYFLNME